MYLGFLALITVRIVCILSLSLLYSFALDKLVITFHPRWGSCLMFLLEISNKCSNFCRFQSPHAHTYTSFTLTSLFCTHFFELFITFFQQSHSLQIHPNLTSCSITPTHKDKIHPRYTSRYTHLTDRHTYEIIKFGLLPISDRQTDRHTHT